MLALGVVGVMPWAGSVGLFAFLVALPVAGLGLGIAARLRSMDETGTVRRTARRAMFFGGIELGLLLLIVALLFPSPTRSRESAMRVMCGSNLRQIGQGIMLYAQANGGRFPPDLPELVLDGMMPEVLVCPSSSAGRASGPTSAAVVLQLRTQAGHCSYVYSGLGLTSAKVTAAHVIAYDVAGNHGKHGINVLYGDWSVQWLSQREATYFISELSAGRNPPRVQAAPAEK
jgi:hypothetical protein